MADSDWPGSSPQTRGELGKGEGTGPVLGGDTPTVQPGYPPVQDPSLPPYPYPGAASQPFYPYGAPPTPYPYPYGQPAAPSQPLYPYGGYGPPSQYPSTASGPRRSYRGLLIGVVIAVVLALLGTGAFVGISQYQAPAQAAEQFCTSLKAQDYVAAYDMFSFSLQAEYTYAKFSQGFHLLNIIEGNITGCGPSAGSAYDYTLFGSTATISAVIDRAQSGTLLGKLHLVNQNGWKIAGIDTSLLGVNLTSLQTVGSFCKALQNGDYAGAYALLGSTLQAQVSASTFAQDGALHRQIDGRVTDCSIAGVNYGNSDTSTSLLLSITRSTLGIVAGDITLNMDGGAWKISSLDTALEGSDLGGLLVLQKFCSYIKSEQLTKAYGLIAGSLQAYFSFSLFESYFAPQPGVTFGCTLQLNTYVVIDVVEAHIYGALTTTYAGQTQSVAVEFYMGFEEAAWKVDSWAAA